MIKKYICLILILISLLFTLTGCYDSNGIEDFYYIVALAIDKKENNLISLSIQTATTSDSSNSLGTEQSNQYKIYTVDANSIDSGINILNNYLNKKINLSHCSAIIFSEEIARKGLKEYINILGNDTEVRPDCNIIISSKKAVDILNKISNSGESFSSKLYESILTSANYTGYTIKSKFNNFFSRTNSQQTQATAIYASINEETIQSCGSAIFKEDKMLGTISPSQTIAHQIITNELDTCLINIDSPFINGKKIDLNLKKISNPNIDISLINKTPFININIKLEATVDSSNENFDYTIADNINLVEKCANEYLENLIKEYLNLITKKYNSDIIGFGGMYSAKYRTIDDFYKIHWNEIFKESYYKVNVTTIITSSHLFNKE